MSTASSHALFVLLCTAPLAIAGEPGLVFTNISDSSGVADITILTESLSWGDYDNDGDEDLYLTNDGPNVLLRNDGNGVFADVTSDAGVGTALWSVGTAFGDLDNDGDLDLYVVNFGAGLDVLYQNNGDGTFTDITIAAGVTDQSSSRGMGFTDFDRDGLLDIYVNAIGPDILYHNTGSMQFTNIASDLGVGIAIASGQGVGIVCTDIDNDGLVDLFTGNRSFDINWLFRNTSFDGSPSFQILSTKNGITESGLGMGVLSLDYDNDLDFDLYWTAWPSVSNAFYENLGDSNSNFVNVASETGTLDPLGWGISCNAADVNNDGYEDFFVTNGFSDSSTPSVLFQNIAGVQFTDASGALQGGVAFDGRGVAFADIDNDGDMDLCVTADLGEPTQLWRNDSNTGANSWIAFKLEGTCSNRSAFGARVTVEWQDAGGSSFTVKEISGGAGRGSFNSIPIEFGNTATAVLGVDIRWPNGNTQHIDGAELNLNAYNAIIEPFPADFGAPHGVLNIFDVLAFIDLFNAADPAADLTQDESFDIFDLLAFLDLFNAGCP